MKTTPCIGCGYCCRKVRCAISYQMFKTDDKKCKALKWNGKRWICEIVCFIPTIGFGCSSALNTYRLKKYIPSPDELKDENKLLRKLNNIN